MTVSGVAWTRHGRLMDGAAGGGGLPRGYHYFGRDYLRLSFRVGGLSISRNSLAHGTCTVVGVKPPSLRHPRTIPNEATSEAQQRGTRMDAQSASNEQAIRELAERLMCHPHPEGPTTTQLLLRRLPDTVTVDVPLPRGAALLGSQLKTLAGRPASVEAVMDADGDPSAVLEAYEDQLRAAGWRAFEGFGPPHGGFISAEMGDGRVLRKGDAGPVLAISAVARPGEPVDVRVRLDWEMVRHMPTGPRGIPPGADLLPPLRPPPGVALRGQTGSGGNGRWTSETTVHTDRPVAELEAHFAAQLTRAGWARTSGSADDAVGWSAWQLPGDEGWRGLLLVLAPFGQTERFVSVRIERSESSEDDGPYFALS
jgi:hypothetical protein